MTDPDLRAKIRELMTSGVLRNEPPVIQRIQRGGQVTESAQASQASVPPAAPLLARVPEASVPGLCPLSPRLLDLTATAQYLGVSPWTVRDLEAARALKRVSIPLPGGRDLRKLLFDRVELDALVDAWKR